MVRRAALLTFAIVGGGPTGVEMAGQIAEIARSTRKDFRVVDTSRARVLLIEAGPRVLATFPPERSAKAVRALQSLGVTTLLDQRGHRPGRRGRGRAKRRARGAHPGEDDHLGRGRAGGGFAGKLAHAAGVDTDRIGRVIVEPDLTLRGHPEVFAIGDMVRCASLGDRPPYPGLAPVAMQMGRHAALAGARAPARPAHGGVRLPGQGEPGDDRTVAGGRRCARAEAQRLRGLGDVAGGAPRLIGIQNRMLVVLRRWTISFITHGRGARLISGEERET